jgi:carboxylesterase
VIGALVAGAGAAGLLAARALVARRLQQAAARRLPVGPTGIVAGAEPFELPARADAPALLLLHGFGDTPQTLRYVAAALHAAGFAVRVPLLPGHGRTLREFARSGADAWLAHARAELDVVVSRHARVGLVGLSMGGALAATLAAETPAVGALALLAPYLSMPRTVRRLARIHPLLALGAPYLPGRGERSIHDPEEAERNLAYGVVTPRLLRELLTVVTRAQAALPALRVPTLMLQSCEDNRIPVDAAEREFARIGAPDRKLEWLQGCGHLISVDHGHPAVAARTAAFLSAHLPVVEAAPMLSRGA